MDIAGIISNVPHMAGPVLHMFCGKMAAGKSTLAARLSEPSGMVLITEDEWLSALYGEDMRTGADFLAYSGRLRAAMGPHISTLLGAGVSVVLDFAANTRASRNWMRIMLDESEADHYLHVLTPPDDVCLQRLHARNAKGDHPFAPTEEQFFQFSKHFMRPTPDEGFNLVMHT